MNGAPTSPIRAELPREIGAITAGWLTEALSARYAGTEVSAVHIGTVIAGTATKIRLLLEYNGAGHAHRLPPTLWLKGGFICHDHTYFHAFRDEAAFFRDWAPHLAINIPTCYYAADDGLQGLVLLEDLLARNVSFGRATLPISVDQQAQTLDLLAALHANWWQSEKLAHIQSFTNFWVAADRVVSRMLEPSYFASCLASSRGTPIQGRYRDPEQVATGLRAQWRHADDIAQCFTHGDAHLGNMYFERDGSPGFLDWQAWQRGPYMHDVAYSIIGNLTVEDRRRHQHDLLTHYRNKLASHGVAKPPSATEMWDAFRRHAMHGFMWFVTPEQMQPTDVCEAEAERFGTAVVDLNTFGALGV